jgi:membrane protein implicated in regulation of membrane protease activity
VTRITSTPRWLFFRLAILVTLFLWLPDLYILYSGQPATAVAVLMLMHLAIALITYTVLVLLAPVRPAGSSPEVSSDTGLARVDSAPPRDT